MKTVLLRVLQRLDPASLFIGWLFGFGLGFLSDLLNHHF